MLDRSRSRDRSKTGGAFSPAGLFVTGAQGAWYDPSDFSTLYQTSTGTTPVTAVEQPVGLMLDRSRGGPGTNGAFRRNLLTYSEQFDNAAWTAARSSVTASAGVAPDGTTTAYRFIPSIAAQDHFVFQSLSSNVNGTVAQLYVKLETNVNKITLYPGGSSTFAHFNLSNLTTTKEANVTSNAIEVLENGWYRLTAVWPATFASTQLRVYASSGVLGASPEAGDGTSGILIWGAQLELGSTATAYQPITASWAATMAGNHALQATSASRPVLRARYNLLTYSEQFDNAGWPKSGATVTANAAVAPDGTTTADKLVETATTATHVVAQSVTLQNIAYRASLYVKAAERGFALFSQQTDNGISVNLSTGVATSAVGSPTNIISVDAGNGWWRISFSFTPSAGSFGFNIYASVDGVWANRSYLGDGTSGILIWGAQLLTAADEASTGGAYQRIAAATDYDVSNPVWRPYLAFDGVDDTMTISSSINDVFQNVGGGTMWAGYTATAINLALIFISTAASANARAYLLSNRSSGRREDADSNVNAIDAGFVANTLYVGTLVADWAGGNNIRRTNGVTDAELTATESGWQVRQGQRSHDI
jgi:hypothetical protein